MNPLSTPVIRLIRCFFILTWMLLPALSGYGQQNDPLREQRMEELSESLAASAETSAESSLLLEDLGYYAEHPVFINRATEEELLHLNLFNFRQIQTILTYRERYGKILSLTELAVLEGFNPEQLQKIAPFVRFDLGVDSVRMKKERVLHHTLLARIKGSLPVASGYLSKKEKPPVYGGAPYGYFFRYRGGAGRRWEMGLTAENDAGEDFFRKSNRYGFDFLSGFLSWNGRGFVRKIVAGDYHLRFGQGISLWSGGGVSYVSDLASLMRTAEGIRPYSSSDENQFFRGCAVQLGGKAVKFSFFYSGKHRDANLKTDSLGGLQISSFRQDGLHRTRSELEDERNINEKMFGGYGDFRFGKWRVGALAAWQRFDFPVTKGTLPYKAYSFEGESNWNAGVDYQAVFNRFSLFGETGWSRNLKPATLHGLIWFPHPQFSLSLQYRYYDPAFQSFYSGAFAEGSGVRNERGFYAAVEYHPVSRVKLGAQADFYYHPWLTYQTLAPIHGRALAFQVEVTPQSNLLLYLHGRFVAKPQKITGVPEQTTEATAKWRLHADWKVSPRVQLRSRLECVGYRFGEKRERGYLAFQDLVYTPSLSLKCWMRMAYYHTDGYDSRVYSYENDLLYYFAIPEFHGKGVRTYLNLKWLPFNSLTLYLKAGFTLRDGADSMGSGYDTTDGNHRFDWRGQLCLRF